MQRASSIVVGARRCGGALLVARRHSHPYFGMTGLTQKYAQGDMLSRLYYDNGVVDTPSATAAAMTGNQNSLAYDTSNIFSVKDFSVMERNHDRCFRGVTRYVIDPVVPAVAHKTAELFAQLRRLPASSDASLTALWWEPVLKDFPSLKTPCTTEFRKAWEDFYEAACQVAEDEAAVRALSVPFLRTQMQQNFIGQAMVWRLAEALSEALDSAPSVTRYAKRVSREVIERVTKIMLNTLADEPWACEQTTSPLSVEVGTYRPWHEAGNW